MRKHIVLLFLVGVEVVSVAYLRIQIWVTITLASGALSAYLYRNEIISLWKLISKPLSRLMLAMCTAVFIVVVILVWLKLEHSMINGLTENLRRIDWAVEEDNVQHFEQELRRLYPLLEKYGLQTPLIDPVSIGQHEYDSTWQGFHLAFLKVLRREVRNGTFNLEQWNADVGRENDKRLAVVSDSEN